MSDKQEEKTEEAITPVAPEEAKAESTLSPIKAELEKVQKKGEGKSELEKARFTRKKIDEHIAELEAEEGIAPPLAEDDDKTVTFRDLKKIEREQTRKTALNLADEQIEDADERELVKHHLQNTLRPSGNPQEDLRHAQALVSTVKNKQLIEHTKQKVTPKAKSSSSGAPAKEEDGEFVPTPEELKFMKPPFNVSKEKIIEARKQAQG